MLSIRPTAPRGYISPPRTPGALVVIVGDVESFFDVETALVSVELLDAGLTPSPALLGTVVALVVEAAGSEHAIAESRCW